MARKKLKKDYTYSVGRRKESSARVRIYKGKGDNLVNDKKVAEYFPGPTNQVKWENPFKVTDTLDKIYFTAKVTGGGKNGQLDAVVLGIARALSLLDPEKFRVPLKKSKLLTRDSRIRERRKVGTGGKARRMKQSPKR
jgi:small subunit ribosomal protein S9